MTHRLLLAALLAAALPLAGCGDATEPARSDGDGGAIDPGAGVVALKSVDVPLPAGGYGRLDLLGADLELADDGEHVAVTVSLRNAGVRAVDAPLVLWLQHFEPASVFVANPDTSLPVASILPVDGFIYDDAFGDDGRLEPGEISAGRRWRFRTPDQGPFAFAVRAELTGPWLGPVISGTCFWDANRDGLRDDDEPPLAPGFVRVLTPDSTRTQVPVAADGTYVYRLVMPGLHEVSHVSGVETFAAVVYTTPNPLHVLVTPDADGVPRSFAGADFGAVTDLPPPVRFTELPADSLHHAPWQLLDARLDGDAALAMRVGFSGCGPHHPFSLWVSGGFMESEPVRARLVLVHERDEACDAAWTQDLRFDLRPLAAVYREAYGAGVLVLELVDFGGAVHPLRWELPAAPAR